MKTMCALVFVTAIYNVQVERSILQMAEATIINHNSAGGEGEVELMIFSGRENPSWQLPEGQAEKVFAMLAALPKTTRKAQERGLGYGGFRVRRSRVKSGLAEEFEIYRGIAFDGMNYFRDEQGKIEKFLLESGKANMSEEVYKIVERAVMSKQK